MQIIERKEIQEKQERERDIMQPLLEGLCQNHLNAVTMLVLFLPIKDGLRPSG